MGICPFCANKIPEDTLLYGGSCPKCFGEIPGEEAATDPGAEVRAKQAKSDNRRAAMKTVIPFMFAVPLLGVGVVVALGFVIWNRDPVFEPLDLDDDEGFEYEIVAAPPEAPDPDPDTPPSVRPVQPDAAAVGPKPIVGGTAGPKPVPVPKPKSNGLPFGGALDDATTVAREGTELCNPDQISKMVKKKMREHLSSRQLDRCYNNARERKADLAGYWRLAMVIQKSGYPKDVSWTGREMKDGPMEKCMSDAVKRWKFGKICSTLPVRKTLKFKP